MPYIKLKAVPKIKSLSLNPTDLGSQLPNATVHKYSRFSYPLQTYKLNSLLFTAEVNKHSERQVLALEATRGHLLIVYKLIPLRDYTLFVWEVIEVMRP
jgi:hypothetical protein